MRDVGSVFAPVERTCAACGRRSKTASLNCPHCGAPFVVVAQRLSRTAKRRVALGAALLLGGVFLAGVLAAPSIQESREERAREDAAERAAIRARETVRVRREQRVVRAEAGPAPRTVLVDRLADFVLRDARARIESGELEGRALRSFCKPFPYTSARAAAERNPGRERGRYLCTVVTSEIVQANGGRGTLGFPFSAVIEYPRGRMAWCKTNLLPGEKSIGRELVRVPLDPSCT